MTSNRTFLATCTFSPAFRWSSSSTLNDWPIWRLVCQERSKISLPGILVKWWWFHTRIPSRRPGWRSPVAPFATLPMPSLGMQRLLFYQLGTLGPKNGAGRHLIKPRSRLTSPDGPWARCRSDANGPPQLGSSQRPDAALSVSQLKSMVCQVDLGSTNRSSMLIWMLFLSKSSDWMTQR